MAGKYAPATSGGEVVFGLDIGIASVGWAVLGSDRIIDLGVRAFDKAETAKEGESLNLTRRTARLMRRRLRRKASRMKKVARLLVDNGVIENRHVLAGSQTGMTNPWILRKDALDRCLNADEFARVIYHLCKHRGFHWQSRAEEKQADNGSDDGGRVKTCLADTQKRLREKGYRTAAEMVLAEFPDAQRNKHGDYSKSLSRVMLSEELALIFSCQRRLLNPLATDSLESALLGNGDRKSGLFWKQEPALAGKNLLAMLGKCTFEKSEYRAPKASFSAERHVWLTRLNNLRIVIEGKRRPLNSAERELVLPLPYQQSSPFSYKQLRNALVKKGYLEDSFRFAGLAYPSEHQKLSGKSKDPENDILIRLPAWQLIRKSLTDAGLKTEWENIAGAAHAGNPELLDQIAWILSVYKDDTEVTNELEKLALPRSSQLIRVLSECRFDQFSNLSLKALGRILPHMENGLRYDEAVALVPEYGHHSQLSSGDIDRSVYLPTLYSGGDRNGTLRFNPDLEVPRNPVVLRALNQARKVVNALVQVYGSPQCVHIEMARDLSRPLDERRKVEKAQTEYRERNERDKAVFLDTFGQEAKGQLFEKWQLYREQQGKCAYSLQAISIERLFEPGYVEVDHALPYSRSFDDSRNNKVLVLATENRAKGNRTPYEYLTSFKDGERGERWRRYVSFVEDNPAYRVAKRNRLLRKDFSSQEEGEFRERNLNDTRYICRFFKNYVEKYLALSGENRRCVVVNGQLTAFLRARWGLVKERGESDRHHAMDATVVASCTHGMVKRLADYARNREIRYLRTGLVDTATGHVENPAAFDQLQKHFPEPWPHFRNELLLRLFEDDPDALRKELMEMQTYTATDLQQVRPVFISRAPQRRNGGAAHKETIYSQPPSLVESGSVKQKIALTSLTIKDIDTLIDPHRNHLLYEALRSRLIAHHGKADKAFGPDNPFYKPDNQGRPNGPIVRTVTKLIPSMSGIPVRGGIAKNDTMLRVDVFTRSGKFYLVPVYVHHRVKGLPDRAIVAGKPESAWDLMDDSCLFMFSLYPNDLVHITLKTKKWLGYFAGCNRSTGGINIWLHDRDRSKSENGQISGIGVKIALSVEKLHVDVLGRIYPAHPEMRHDLA